MSAPESSAKAVADSSVHASLADDRPRDLRRHRQGTRPPARRDRADRVGEHRQPRGARGAGLGADQQVRRGLPGKRYYGGCQYVDIAETLAIERVKKLFGAAFANVQPHSGAPANAAAFMALMQPGRHVPRPEPRRRRPSHPRLAGQRVRQVVQGGALRRAPRRPPHRHGRGARLAERAQAEGDRRRRLGLSAHHRLQGRSARSPTASAPS